ncbi:gas vesicle structural protein GvpA [Streptomonospora sp. PA3]|uniref:gas vesicle structural protein GvpA n=1 Tax=Streptomonospora sp. PA3 TaxID=2607326 RepID=UPI0031BB00D8
MQQTSGSGGRSGNLYEVLDLILDKGLVIDVFARVSLVGIELLTVDVRIVVASVDTYLRFAEACNRLDLSAGGGAGLPDLVNGATESGARSKTKGALAGAADTVKDTLGRDSEEERPTAKSGRRSGRKEAE